MAHIFWDKVSKHLFPSRVIDIELLPPQHSHTREEVQIAVVASHFSSFTHHCSLCVRQVDSFHLDIHTHCLREREREVEVLASPE